MQTPAPGCTYYGCTNCGCTYCGYNYYGPTYIQVFREWDGDGSGTVSKQEFRQGLGRLGLREIDAQQADVLFDEIDVDHSGEIQYRELNSKLRRRAELF